MKYQIDKCFDLWGTEWWTTNILLVRTISNVIWWLNLFSAKLSASRLDCDNDTILISFFSILAIPLPLWFGKGRDWEISRGRSGMVPRGAQEPRLLRLHQATHSHHHRPITSCLVNIFPSLYSYIFLMILEFQFTADCVTVLCLGTLGVNLLLPQPLGTKRPISWSWIASWTQPLTWMPSRISSKHHLTLTRPHPMSC